MFGIDPAQAARDLAEADLRRRRGAQLTAPRWWQPVGYLFFVVLNAVSWDMPPSRLRGVLMLTLGLAMLVAAVLADIRARARPLPIPVGRRAWLLAVVAVAISIYAVMLGAGFGLRALAVPLPFTVSSILVVIALWLLLRWKGQRWGGSYAQLVGRGQW